MGANRRTRRDGLRPFDALITFVGRMWAYPRRLCSRRPVWQAWRMRSLKFRPARQVLPSEQGLLELADRQSDRPLREVFVHFRDLVSADMDWADSRKARFRRAASRV